MCGLLKTTHLCDLRFVAGIATHLCNASTSSQLFVMAKLAVLCAILCVAGAHAVYVSTFADPSPPQQIHLAFRGLVCACGVCRCFATQGTEEGFFLLVHA